MSSNATHGRPALDEQATSQAAPIERGEALIVAAAVVQGLALGAWLTLFPHAALRAGGFPPAAAFFVRWAGTLHALLAAGYALDWIRFRRTTLLVLVKAATALFLVVTWAVDHLPPLMMVAVAVEAGTALLAAVVHGPASRARHARARLRLVTSAERRARRAGTP